MTKLNIHGTTNKDPMTADIGPFESGQIPFSRPVLGGDLEAIQVRLGLQVSDAIWLFGLNTQSWYAHTTDPVRKLKRKLEREHKKLEVKRENLLSQQENLREKHEVCDEYESAEIRGEFDRLENELTTLAERLDDAVPTPTMLGEAEEARERSTTGPTKPVSETLALLIRFFDAFESYVRNVSAKLPSVHDFQHQLNGLSARDMAQLVGRDASAGYRWIELDALPHPTVGRLMDCLSKWLEEGGGEGIPKIEIWWNVVRREYAIREVCSGNIQPSSTVRRVQNSSMSENVSRVNEVTHGSTAEHRTSC